ncbi:MAG TPA: 2-dehydro-3-deoxygalactonokinase [Acetobacteraceae bacterium]|nr:2-dehydro-3-deoxygalactonokinase [Acetobacteraceae bacterium]
MIGVEWTETSLRAFRLGADGTIRDRKSSPRGMQRVQDGRFADTLREEIGPWLAAGEDRVLLAGPIGGRGGWIAAPYLACPAGAAELADALVPVPFGWAQVKLVPGLATTDEGGVPEVMRGEETQFVGGIAAMDERGLAAVGERGILCLPGPRSRWARIEGGRIAGFVTWMTGEAHAALRVSASLGRMTRDGPTDLQAFDQGLARSADAGGLLHHLFGVRALGLAGRLSEGAAPAYLSGLLIGHEVREAVPRGAAVDLIGPTELVALYARAITACRGRPIVSDGEAAARGLFLIGERARWS